MLKRASLFLCVCLFLVSSQLCAEVILSEKFSVGGQIRTRFEQTYEQKYGVSNDSLTLLRTRFHADFKPKNFLRGFIQFQDSRVWGEEDTTANALDNLDLHQGYVDLVFQNMTEIQWPFTLRLGRQAFSFGDERILGAFEWDNVARAFDAIRLIYDRGSLNLHAWSSKIEDTVIPPNASTGDEEDFHGFYSTWKAASEQMLDVYGFFDRDNSTATQGGDVWTGGARWHGKTSIWDWDIESAFQFGKLAGNTLRAFAIHGAAHHTFSFLKGLRLGAEYNLASGDKSSTDNRVQTFDNLFPTNHLKYGYMDLVSLRNAQNFALRSNFKPRNNVPLFLSLDYWYFLLHRNTDNAYRASGASFRSTVAGASKKLGQEIDFTAEYKYEKDLSILLGASHFFAGQFLEDTGESKDANFFYTQLVMNF